MDPDMVTKPERIDLKIYEIRANHIAKEIGFAMAGNMVFLGALNRLTGILTEEQLFDGIKENVPERFAEVNIKAARTGIEVMTNLLKAEE